MTPGGTTRTRTIALAATAALVAGLGLYWWTTTGEPPTALPPLAASSPRATASREEPMRPPIRPSSRPEPRNALKPYSAPPASPLTEPSSQVRPTPSVFDFATIGRSGETRERKDEDRFRTNERFTEEDLQHPERYFEVAERMQELNRPEERRDTLDFFLAYRDKLRRDLEAVGEDRDKRQEILATIERYDDAIARLRKLLDAEEAK